MTSIRAQLDAHSPILAERSDNEGFVLVEHEDIRELSQIAGEPAGAVHRFRSTTATHVEIATSYFAQLVDRAHVALHGDGRIPQSNDTAAQLLLDAIFSDPEDLNPTQEYDGEGVEPGVDEQEYATVEEANYRSTAMHFAVHITVAKIQGSSGLESVSFDDDAVVTQAEKILAFLKG